MMGWLRRIRGILGIGAVWGSVGVLVGALITAVVAVVIGGDLFSMTARGAVFFGAMGGVCGSGFAGLLTLLEGRRTLDELSPARAALWGALAGAAIPAAWAVLMLRPVLEAGFPLTRLLASTLGASLSFAAVTAGLAAGTIALARRPSAALEGGHGQELLADSTSGGPE
jgi:hypothetical protein